MVEGTRVDAQADLFGARVPAAPAIPPGFRYQPEIISAEVEARLVANLAELPFKPFEFHGYLGNRRVVSFGYRYDYARRAVEAATPMPAFLQDLREHLSGFGQRPAEDFVQVLINEYAPGAGIGWHRDKPQFGLVLGLSLLAPCVLRLRRKAGAGWERRTARLEPRSAYLLDGAARTEWEHSITPMEDLRYSITFRTLPAGGHDPPS